jgi:hypothetical protein
MKYFMSVLLFSIDIVYMHYTRRERLRPYFTFPSFPLRRTSSRGRADEIIQVMADEIPFSRTELSLKGHLGLFPQWQCISQPGPPLGRYGQSATPSPPLRSNGDQSIGFEGRQIPGQSAPVHPHDLGERRDGQSIIGRSGDKYRKLRGAKSNRPQRVIVCTGHDARRNSYPVAGAVFQDFSLRGHRDVLLSSAYTLHGRRTSVNAIDPTS